MNSQKGPLHIALAKFKWMLFALALWASSTILLSCKPAALPSTFSSSIILPPTLTEVAIRQMLATKVADIASIDQTETALRLTPHPKVFKPTFGPGSPLATPTLILSTFPPMSASDATPAGAGLIAVIGSGGYGAPYRIGNRWIEDIHNGRTRIEVEAGVENGPDGLPSAQGIIVVEIWQKSVINNSVAVNRIGMKIYPAPIQAGFLEIVDAVGERLILRSENGTTFYFDVPSYQFVPSMTWVDRNPISPIPTPVGTVILIQATPSP